MPSDWCSHCCCFSIQFFPSLPPSAPLPSPSVSVVFQQCSPAPTRSLPSLCTLTMLALWLQGFPVCIYSVFIGAWPCFSICLSTATMYPTHQFTRHSPWISEHHRPWLQSLTAHKTSMSVLPPLSHLPLFFFFFFLTKVVPNPKSLDLCPADSCLFFFFLFTTQLLLFLSFTISPPLTHFFRAAFLSLKKKKKKRSGTLEPLVLSGSNKRAKA